MFRNQYNTDVTTWSRAGRLFQVEYAMGAVKQGSAAIGLRSKTHVVLGCVNTANSELSSHQKQIFKRRRCRWSYRRRSCPLPVHAIRVFSYSFTYEPPLPVGRLVVQLADKAQVKMLSL